MKAKEVLKLLNVSRQSLTRYIALGYLEVSKLPNGQYDYNEESIFKFLNRDIKRKIKRQLR